MCGSKPVHEKNEKRIRRRKLYKLFNKSEREGQRFSTEL